MGHDTDSQSFDFLNLLKRAVMLRCCPLVGICQCTFQALFNEHAHAALGKVGGTASHILGNIHISFLFTFRTAEDRVGLGSSSIVERTDLVDAAVALVTLDPGFFWKRVVIRPKESRLHDVVAIIQSDGFLRVQLTIALLTPTVLVRSKHVISCISLDPW